MTKHTPGPKVIRAAGPSGSEIDLSTLTATDLRRWYDRAVYIHEFEGSFETFHELVVEGRIEVEHHQPPEQLMHAINRMQGAMMAIGINAYEIAEILTVEDPVRAAAPDLLETLCNIKTRISIYDFHKERNVTCSYDRLLADIVADIRAAIAKAEPKL